jgi:hypothetical protein
MGLFFLSADLWCLGTYHRLPRRTSCHSSGQDLSDQKIIKAHQSRHAKFLVGVVELRGSTCQPDLPRIDRPYCKMAAVTHMRSGNGAPSKSAHLMHVADLLSLLTPHGLSSRSRSREIQLLSKGSSRLPAVLQYCSRIGAPGYHI